MGPCNSIPRKLHVSFCIWLVNFVPGTPQPPTACTQNSCQRLIFSISRVLRRASKMWPLIQRDHKGRFSLENFSLLAACLFSQLKWYWSFRTTKMYHGVALHEIICRPQLSLQEVNELLALEERPTTGTYFAVRCGILLWDLC